MASENRPPLVKGEKEAGARVAGQESRGKARVAKGIQIPGPLATDRPRAVDREAIMVRRTRAISAYST